MAGHRCPIIHQLNLKARVNIKNGQLKAIKVTLRLSQCHVHAPIVEHGFHFLIIYNHKINHYGSSDLFGTPMVSHHKVQLSTTPIKWLQVLDRLAASNIFSFNLHGATTIVAGPQETATHTSKNKCKVPTLGSPKGLVGILHLFVFKARLALSHKTLFIATRPLALYECHQSCAPTPRLISHDLW
jgi:hypothetical protein